MRLCAFLLLAAAALPLNAGIVYQYTGNPYVSVSPPFTTSDFITISIEFASPLAPNLVFQDLTSGVTAFQMSDGINTLSTPDVVVLSTDVSGIPVSQWFVRSLATGVTIQSSTSTTPPYVFGNQDFTLTDVGSGLSFAPGSWSIVSAGVPEPASGSLMLLAGGLLALLRRRTRR